MVAIEALSGYTSGYIDDWPKPQLECLKDVHYLHGLFPKDFLEVQLFF